MNKLRYILTLLALAFTALVALAQNRTVRGNVTAAADGAPVPGCYVSVEGTKLGGITDLDGNFEIKNVPESAQYVVTSFMGAKDARVAITPNMKIVLEDDAEILEGAVVANCKIDGVGGLYGGQGNAAEESKTYSNKVNATITTDASVTNFGLVVGKISSGAKVVVLGTDANPIQVKGTVNGTAVTAENLANFLFNGGTAVDNKSVKAVLWTE